MSCNSCPDGHTHDHHHHEEDMEAQALLRYMIDHNKHHADELYDLAGKLDGSARELVHAAVIDYETGTDKLEKALKALEH
ncbi:MAG: hypothetical protein J6T17_08690 [Clostridia bacterium]|nr:hypothetical protein [Clostridia bacterium]